MSSLMTFVILGGCAITPKPLTNVEVSEFAEQNLKNVDIGQEPVTAPISLYEAMARAIKYNLDFRVALYDEAVDNAKLNAARLDSLPQLVASSDYNGRNNYSGSRSARLPDLTTQAIDFNTSSERETFTNNIDLSWNILDFGLSRVRAEQTSNEALIKGERRRKVINRIVEDVRTAYWRAATAERLLSGLSRLEARARKALRDSEALSQEGDTSPITALSYQRELVEIQQRIEEMQRSLSVANDQLAALMNLRPGSKFRVVQPSRTVGTLGVQVDADELIEIALRERPEMREVQYRQRINIHEAKAALLELLPSANFNVGASHDTNKFLFNNDWVSWGARVSWNLFKIFQYPARRNVIDAQDALLEERALALTMAIMTQVHVSRARFFDARKRFQTASKHLSIQNRILRQIREATSAGTVSEQNLIREEMNTLASQVAQDIVFAEYQNAYANVYASVGLDAYHAELDLSSPVDDIAVELERLWRTRGDQNSGKKLLSAASKRRLSSRSSESSVLVAGSLPADTAPEPRPHDANPAVEFSPVIVLADETDLQERRYGIFLSRQPAQNFGKTAGGNPGNR